MSTSPDCLFCKIVSGTIPATKFYEDERILAFADINPQAPKHLLIIPKIHYANAGEAPADLLGYLLHAAATAGRTQMPEGYRIVLNTGVDGGQTVDHLHLHLLGARHLGWPPG